MRCLDKNSKKYKRCALHLKAQEGGKRVKEISPPLLIAASRILYKQTYLPPVPEPNYYTQRRQQAGVPARARAPRTFRIQIEKRPWRARELSAARQKTAAPPLLSHLPKSARSDASVLQNAG